MPVAEQTYQPQLGPASTAPLPMRDSSANDRIGSSMERLGDTLHRNRVQDFQIERRLNADREAADFSVRFAQARAKFDAFSSDQRNAAAPDAAGHADAMKQAWDAEAATLLHGLTEKGLQNNAKAQLAEFGGRLFASEYEWQEGKRVGKLVTDQVDLSNIAANRARLAHDPRSFAEELSLGRQGIEAMAGVPQDVRDKLIKSHEQTVTAGFLNGLNDTNPKAAVALIDAGAFNDMLTPEQLDQARNGAMVEVRRLDAAAAHQQQLQAAAVRDSVQGLKAQISAGVTVDDAELAKAQQGLSAIGDAGGATAMGVLRVQNGVNRETEPWTPAQFDAEINRLAGLDKRTPEQDVRLKALRDRRPGAVATYNNNPGEWAAKNGMPPPPLNLADPASINARLKWTRVVEDRTGRPVKPLQPAEAALLREAASSSPNGRVQVADQIAALGGYATLQAAKQIAPDDPMLGRLAQLGDPVLRRTAAKGAEIRATRKDLIDGTNGNDARDDFYEALGGAGSLMQQGDVGAAYEVARNLYASRATGANYDAKDFERATHEALGGTYSPTGAKLGGLGSAGRNPVLLPDGMSDAAFDKVLARFGATPLRGPMRPVWHDGTPMTGADVRSFMPVKRPDGRYEFHDSQGGKITVKDGRTWIIDLAEFGRQAHIWAAGQ